MVERGDFFGGVFDRIEQGGKDVAHALVCFPVGAFGADDSDFQSGRQGCPLFFGEPTELGLGTWFFQCLQAIVWAKLPAFPVVDLTSLVRSADGVDAFFKVSGDDFVRAVKTVADVDVAGSEVAFQGVMPTPFAGLNFEKEKSCKPPSPRSIKHPSRMTGCPQPGLEPGG